MGLYTRKEYEDHLKQIDVQIAKSASLLGEQLIGPQQHWMRCRQLEELKRKLGMKLAMTAIALNDKSRMEKSGRFAWVIGAKKRHEEECKRFKDQTAYCSCYGEWYLAGSRDPLIKHQGPHYRVTTLGEIYELQNNGVTVMESGFNKSKKKSAQEPEHEEYEVTVLEWKTLESAREAVYMQQAGEFREKDGKRLWYAYYMIRTEGEGANQRYYYTDVR